MNCSELDGVVQEGIVAVQSDAGFFLLMVLLFLTSGTLLVAGELLARPLAGLVAGTTSAVGVFVVTQPFGVACPWRLGLSLAAAVGAAALALCLLKGGLFALGATAFGATAHVVYQALPMDPGDAVFLGESVYYYGSVAVAGLLGAVVSVVTRTYVLRITTSLLGGSGVAATTYLVADRSGESVPSLALVGIMNIASLVGLGTQHAIARRRKKSPA